MKKTYWWRVVVLVFFGLIMILSYFGPCENKLERCLGGNSILLVRTLFHLSIPILFSGLFLFLVGDNIFIKWLKLSVILFFISLFFISITPEYSGGWVSFTPDKEQVSIWMSALFLVISIVMITIWSIKDKKYKK